jgi:hypothetical protein
MTTFGRHCEERSDEAISRQQGSAGAEGIIIPLPESPVLERIFLDQSWAIA